MSEELLDIIDKNVKNALLGKVNNRRALCTQLIFKKPACI